MEKGRIAVMIPVWNEGETLTRVLSSVPPEISGHEAVIVISDDHSEDDTVDIAAKFTDHIVTSPARTGVGANVRRGLAYIARLSRVRYVVKFDGDGQHDPAYLPRVVDALEGGADIVSCSRFHPRSETPEPPPLDRLLLNRVMSALVTEITGWHVTDARTGFMAFRSFDVAAIADKLVVKGYGIPMEILLRLWRHHSHADFTEIPHPALYRNVSHRLEKKYACESLEEQSERLKVAYQALLSVLIDMGIEAVDVMKKIEQRLPKRVVENILFHPVYPLIP